MRLPLAATLAGLAGLAAPLAAVDISDIEIHGFVSQGYLKSDNNDFLGQSERGSSNFAEAAVNFSTNVTERLRVGMQLFARNFADTATNERMYLDWGFADYKFDDLIGVRIGRFKDPFGLYGEVLDVDLSHTSVLLPQSVYDTRRRDYFIGVDGIDLYGTLALRAAGSLDYQLYGGTQTPQVDGTTAQQTTNPTLGHVTEFTVDRVLGGQLMWNAPLDGLRLGASAVYTHDATQKTSGGTVVFPGPIIVPVGPFDLEIRHVWDLVGSAEYRWRDWILTAEYSRTRAPYTVTDQSGTIPRRDLRIDYEGYYGQVEYRLPELSRAHWTKDLTLGSYYSWWRDRNTGKGLVGPQLYQGDWCFSARYDVNRFWLVKGEVHAMRGVGLITDDGTDPQTADHEHWTLFAVKTTVNF